MIEFLAVTILTVMCLLAIAQMAVWVWARNVAVSAVHEGARTAAETGRPLDDGVAQTRSLLQDGLGGSGRGFCRRGGEQDGNQVAVRARGTAPLIIPFLPRFDLEVQATAFDEDDVLPMNDRASAEARSSSSPCSGASIFGVLVQAIVLFGVLHRATLATSAAAREYGRAIVVADSPEIRPNGAARWWSSRPRATTVFRRVRCRRPSRVGGPAVSCSKVHVRTEVAVFRIPFLGDVIPSVSVPVEATHVGAARPVPQWIVMRVRESGQASVVIVGALLICLAFTGLAVDGARLFTARRDLQNVADSAALAGASAIDVGQFRASAGERRSARPRRGTRRGRTGCCRHRGSRPRRRSR